ncbi:GNAT family N-acetyltransferase [Bacillus suaedaesalsae]|uniref:GNAT family N-acetyltransferase n=1 Tax=Bacillus suaedaesalsae TaxID=2810349 RepID=A0ABS2DJR4_9BACI|nr:GNAT family N-acetyltransferase [Bacillus suaedaesalsae]MBM6618742.1 GNAT family N-acetyltransferase [Bacillus suaedaesalsae]
MNMMTELQLVTNIREIDLLRNSFNDLAQKTFGINFKTWYEKGYWTDKYIPFCYVENNKVVANVSVNFIDIIVNDEKKRAIQIGTVMTDSDYRNQGLSRKLLEEVSKTYKGQYDIMYLFANDSVLQFYPKFGFVPREEYIYFMIYKREIQNTTNFKKLDGTNEDDLNFIYQFASKRLSVSTTFSTTNSEELLMFYCVYVFSHDIYYSESQNVIVICKHEDSELHIFDLISHQKVNIETILSELSTSETEKVVFHYTPDYENVMLEKTLYIGSEQLFVKLENGTVLPQDLKHPLTSQA